MTYDPNFPMREPDRIEDPREPARGWTLGIGVAIVLAIIAFLATGKQHSNDQAAAPMAQPASNAMVKPPAMNTPASPTLPAPRIPTETTGSGTTENK